MVFSRLMLLHDLLYVETLKKKYNFNLTENCFLVSIISKIYNQDGNPARLLLLGRGRWVFHLLFANKEKRYLHLLHIVLL